MIERKVAEVNGDSKADSADLLEREGDLWL
jgi:hypothetical protein